MTGFMLSASLGMPQGGILGPEYCHNNNFYIYLSYNDPKKTESTSIPN